MAVYINFEAEASDDDEIPMDDDPIFDDPMLIGDAEDQINNEPSFYRFVNQTTDTDEMLALIREEEDIAAQSLEPANYMENFENEDEIDIDEESSSQKNKEKFLNTLINPIGEQTKENSFFSALIYTINFCINKETKKFEDEVLRDKTGSELFQKLNAKKQICVLDLDRANFDNMCFDINEILVEHVFVLRVCERKDKFRYLFHKKEEKTDTIKTLPTCLMVKFNGFKSDSHVPKNFYQIKTFPSHVRKSTIICLFGV